MSHIHAESINQYDSILIQIFYGVLCCAFCDVMEHAFVQFDPHDEEAGPGLVHGQDHPLVTHLLQLSVLHNLNLQPI